MGGWFTVKYVEGARRSSSLTVMYVRINPWLTGVWAFPRAIGKTSLLAGQG